MTVIVTGSREHADRELIRERLDAYAKIGPFLLVQGGATGADALAREWAGERGVECRTYEAEWDKYGVSAGPRRNRQMLDAHLDACVVAFPLPNSRGTWNCVREAQKRGMRVDVYTAALEANVKCSEVRVEEVRVRESVIVGPRAEPFLRWAGSKRHFAREYGDDLRAEVLSRGGRYVEPFLGGGAMALHLGLPDMLLGDAERDLVWAWEQVKDAPDLVCDCLDWMRGRVTEKDYYEVRARRPETYEEAAARFIYLNKTSFNGLWRKNKNDEYNVPWGRSEKRTLPSREELRAASAALVGATLVAGDFEKLVDRAGVGDLIYADPPYDGAFSDYTAGGFSADDRDRLAAALWRATTRGAAIVAHDADTPTVRAMYHWAEVAAATERRAINSDGAGRGEVPCVVVTAGWGDA